jgi:hypothetical protein
MIGTSIGTYRITAKLGAGACLQSALARPLFATDLI